ncbi:amidohydrolase [bacterium BMS3Abin05]|nr:amidohydrolase [bacterium BMS3Abin05]
MLDQEKFKNLHLNLAHFGWYTPEGYTGNITWVKDICKMLDDYNYLFTDVSCHRVVLKKYIQKFKSDYKKIGSDFPIVKERLLFGTDWHVLKRVPNFRDFKDDYIAVLKHENNFNDAEIKNFLSGNALNFLGLYKGGKNLKRLEKFYKDNNINPPEWFKSIRLSDGRS